MWSGIGVKRARDNGRYANRVPLQLADGSGSSFDLQGVTVSNNYEIPVILPDDVTCPICTLQVSLRSLSNLAMQVEA